jgi:serine/threonine-protein kinase
MTSGLYSAPPTSMPFPPGTVLAGKYRIERLLGEGGMGWVVVATHLHLEQRVALKFMRESHATEQPDAVARFLREARAAARIQSEHVARVTDFGTLENGAPYLVMEYLEGQDLESLLESKRPVPLTLAVDYAMQACEGLAEAHAAGIVHRDLKPANLFLAKRSDASVRVKLLDFGISKLASTGGAADVGMTSTQALMGSPLYMSPEQLRSSKNVDRRTDIWSMGVILYEMFGGRSPFESDTLPEVCARVMAEPPPLLGSIKPELPPALDGVVMRCLEKEPNRRFPDVASLAQALAPFGPPEARATADRIARLGRASALGHDNTVVDPGATGPVQRMPSGRHGVARTDASFGTAGPTRPRRSPVLGLAIGGGVVVVAAVVLGIVAVRGKTPATPAVVPAPEVSAMVSSTPPPPVPTPPTASESTSAPAVPAATTPTPATATRTIASATATAAPPRASPKPKPTAATTPPPASAARPASTTGFGGRN